jgi:hypothetical protein
MILKKYAPHNNNNNLSLRPPLSPQTLFVIL